MKIECLGFVTFKMVGESLSIITDPYRSVQAGALKGDIKADLVLDSFANETNKVEVFRDMRESVVTINNPGEYELGGVLIRRPLSQPFYIIDEGYLRLVYMGFAGPDFDVEAVKDLGDVDVLFAPVGNSNLFMDYEKLEKVISYIDPTYLVPYGFDSKNLKATDLKLNAIDDFVKHFGYSDLAREKSLKVTGSPEKGEKAMEIVVIE